MNWKLKSALQNMMSLLPSSVSYSTYYWVQRKFGGLRKANPLAGLRAGLGVCEMIEKAGRSPVGGAFLEIGTGRQIGMPLSFWLLGASRVTTTDLNPYLKQELVEEEAGFLRANRDKIERMFRGRIYNNRLSSLLDFTSRSWKMADLLQHCGIQYIAPADASGLALPPDTFDFHTSHCVLEHIPEDSLTAVLKNGARLLKRQGLSVHRVDYSDHFSHSDRSISSIHFLQFSADEWHRIAGNRYAYANRLRVDDVCELFRRSDLRMLIVDSNEDAAVPGVLKRADYRLDRQFSGKSEKVLATISSWIVAERHD